MQATNELTGVIAIRGKNIGFVNLPDHKEDIFIPTESLSTALDGDVVEIEIRNQKTAHKRAEGAVVRVIERRYTELVGVVEKTEGGYRLVPDNRRIHIRPTLVDATHTHVGMKVAVHLAPWEQPLTTPTATIIEVLGPAGEHETEMQSIIRGGGFTDTFPERVQKAAKELYETRDALFETALSATEGAQPTRRDMRSVTTCTIDPKDAKDFDDAISIRTLPNGNCEIGIHIADVSYYVRENDSIDLEAKERGTSMYLVDRVIPMLPEVLSNDLCSLRPHVDRLAFSAVFEVNTEGVVQAEWFGQTIIHSDKRFTYEEAQAVLTEGRGLLYDELSLLMNISRKLRRERYENGAIAFEQPEIRFELDENKKPVRVYVKERTETMLMVEDFMLLANRKVAEYVHRLSKEKNRDAAFIYRIHDVPNEEKIEELSLFLHALGYELKSHTGTVTAKDINTLLKEIEGAPEENLIKTATIRSMAKAVYTTKNIGHFGLAFKYYTHFTSPIRRYPDLMAHRLLRRHLDGSPISAKEMARYEVLSIQSSEREMTAVKAERDSIKYKQVEYMLDKVGREFDGVVTGVSDWGIYVEEKESKAEGLVRLSNLSRDYYVHESGKYRVKGERTGTTYALGDSVRIKLMRADIEERQLDFKLVS